MQWGIREQRIVKSILFYILLAVILVFLLFPLYWAIVSSLKTGTALFEVEMIPPEPTVTNYGRIFQGGVFHLNILNSVFIAVTAVIISLFLSVTAAFALGRVRFNGRAPLLLIILSVSMFPQVSVLSGLFELIRVLGLYNNAFGLILSYMIFTLPFTVWVLTTFIRDLPMELEEAAIMDGASPWVIITQVFLPLMGPALVTTGLLAFIQAWNEFLFALTFTLTEEIRTVPVAIALISGESQFDLPYGEIMAASVVVTVPLIALVLYFQRAITSGLTAGAVKG